MRNDQILTRREMLKLSGAFAAGAILPDSLRAPRAADNTAPARNWQHAITRDAALPAPPLEIIALNRMAFGPRPGDVERLRALPGASAQEKFATYVEQQLYPEKIDRKSVV
jgi:hypothetical protein